MKKITILFAKLKQQGIRLKLVDERLVVEYGGKQLPADIKEELKLHKQEIIDFLKDSFEAKETYIAIKPIAQQTHYALSNAQKRLWVLEQMGNVNDAYHIVGAYHLVGKINLSILQKACMSLIERHESLRTRFVMNDGEPMQQILSMDEVKFEVSSETQ
jgi:Condensation domain/TubC N-terminal docking domain